MAYQGKEGIVLKPRDRRDDDGETLALKDGCLTLRAGRGVDICKELSLIPWGGRKGRNDAERFTGIVILRFLFSFVLAVLSLPSPLTLPSAKPCQTKILTRPSSHSCPFPIHYPYSR